MAKINAHKAKHEAPKKIAQSSSTDETVELLQSLIDAKKTHKSLTSGYEMPLIEPSKATEAAPQDDTMAMIKKLLAEKQHVAAPPKPVEATPIASY